MSGEPAPDTAFAAAGQTLSVHDSSGTIQATTAVLTSLGYSGEFFDTSAQQQYLRARFYNPANGRFNRLDPFAGNMRDPQSLHKYAYVHGDPVQSVDPTGKFVSVTVTTIGLLTGMATYMSIRGGYDSSRVAVGVSALSGILTAIGVYLAFGLTKNIPLWYKGARAPSKDANVTVREYEENVFQILRRRATPGEDPNSPGVFRTQSDIDWGAREIARVYTRVVYENTAGTIDKGTRMGGLFGTGGVSSWRANVDNDPYTYKCDAWCRFLTSPGGIDQVALRERGWIVEQAFDTKKYGDHLHYLHNFLVVGFRIKREAPVFVSPSLNDQNPNSVKVGKPQAILDPWARGRPDIFDPDEFFEQWPTIIVDFDKEDLLRKN